MAANAQAAAEMVLIRMAYAAELPTPDAVIKQLDASGASSTAAQIQQAPQAQPTPNARAPGVASSSEPAKPDNEPVVEARSEVQTLPQHSQADESTHKVADETPQLASFEDVVKLAGERRDIKLKSALENNVRLIRFSPGQIEISLEDDAERGLPNELSRKLKQWTQTHWVVSVSGEGGAETLADQARARRQSLFKEAREMPAVQAVLNKFPGAEIVDVTDLGAGGEGLGNEFNEDAELSVETDIDDRQQE